MLLTYTEFVKMPNWFEKCCFLGSYRYSAEKGGRCWEKFDCPVIDSPTFPNPIFHWKSDVYRIHSIGVYMWLQTLAELVISFPYFSLLLKGSCAMHKYQVQAAKLSFFTHNQILVNVGRLFCFSLRIVNCQSRMHNSSAKHKMWRIMPMDCFWNIGIQVRKHKEFHDKHRQMHLGYFKKMKKSCCYS